MRVAACQPALDIDDAEGGWRRALALVARAAASGARLVVLPELVTSGYVFTDSAEVALAAAASQGRLAELAELGRRLGVVVVCGHPEVGDGVVHNAAVVLDGGSVVGRYRKVHLWDTEKLWFTPGAEPPIVVDTAVGRVAVMVCYDLEFPEWVRLARQAGADVVAAPVNWPLMPRPDDVLPLEVVKAQATAGSYRIPIVIADRAGSERGVDWIGGSCVVGADGYLVAAPKLDASVDSLVVADVALAGPTELSERNDAFGDRLPQLYAEGPSVR